MYILIFKNVQNFCLQCSYCDFLGQTIGDIYRHTVKHEDIELTCGINGCNKTYLRRNSLRKHLTECHSEFYPLGDYNNIFLNFRSFIKFHLFNTEESLIDAQCAEPNNSPIETSFSASSVINSMIPDQTIDFDHVLVKILTICAKSFKTIPFKALQGFLNSLLDLYSKLLIEKVPLETVFLLTKDAVSSSNRFDYLLETHLDANFPILVNIPSTSLEFSYIPLEKSLVQVLTKYQDQILSPQQIHNDNFSCFFDGNLPKESNTLYLNLFFDDFQIANPLLKKKSTLNELKAFYIGFFTKNFASFESIPIILVSLVKTSTFKLYGDEIMHFLGNEVAKITTQGINIGSDCNMINYKVRIGIFSLDSKEASNLLGMKKSFNHEYCCRFCTVKRSDFRNCLYQEDDKLRNINSYISHLESALSLDTQNNSFFGIENKSFFRFFGIEDFFFRCPPCIMHDFFEGIAQKIIKAIFLRLISTKELNKAQYDLALQQLDFKYDDKSSFPILKFDNIKGFRLVASEAHCFIRFLPFIFESILDISHPLYEIISVLAEFSNFLMAPRISKPNSIYFKSLAANLISLCTVNLPDVSISIKFHHLIHYSDIISRFGPLRFLSTISFEINHYLQKSTIKTSKN